MKIKWSALASVLTVIAACGEAPPAQAPPSHPEPTTAGAATAAPEVAPPPAPTMFDLQLKSLRDYVSAFNKHDASAIAKLYAENAVFVERGELVSVGETSVESNYRRFFDAFPDSATSIKRSWHTGDTVIFEYVEGGTNTGPHGGQAATGKKVGYIGASVLQFDDKARVKKDTTYYDELTMEVQAGWAPGPLAKLEVRPVVPVPAATDTWEVHQLTGVDVGQPKLVAVRKSLYSSFSMGNEKAFLAALSDDVVLSPYDDPKDATGKREAAMLFNGWLKTFSAAVVNADQAWSVDGYVVLLGTFTGKHIGTWGPLKPTMKPFTSHFLDIARINKDDKVERVWTYANNFELLKHLGYR